MRTKSSCPLRPNPAIRDQSVIWQLCRRPRPRARPQRSPRHLNESTERTKLLRPLRGARRRRQTTQLRQFPAGFRAERRSPCGFAAELPIKAVVPNRPPRPLSWVRWGRYDVEPRLRRPHEICRECHVEECRACYVWYRTGPATPRASVGLDRPFDLHSQRPAGIEVHVPLREGDGDARGIELVVDRLVECTQYRIAQIDRVDKAAQQ